MGSELRFKLGNLFYGVIRFLGEYIERGFESGVSLLEFNIIKLEVGEYRISLIILRLERDVFVAPVRVLDL